jgi:hypothetical protein
MTELLRPELTELPPKMRRLLVDNRGYPVPWFVTWIDENDNPLPDGMGKPEFVRVLPEKTIEATRYRKCWVCGGQLGANVAFTIGPMCVVNRISAEPPQHLECSRWSAINCPFLARPYMKRQALGDKPVGEGPGVMIERNPGVIVVWVTRAQSMGYHVHNHLPLFHVGEPTLVEWYSEGREATREEAQRGIDTGLPLLLEMAEKDGPDAVAELEAMTVVAEKFLPESKLESAYAGR